MLTISQNYATPETSLFDQFDDELEESGSLPYLQVINAASKNAKQLDKDHFSYGLALTIENAEAVEFNPSANWQEGEDISIHPLSQATIEKGYVAHTANLVVITHGDTEIQQKIDDRWRFIDMAYRGRELTEAGKAEAAERESGGSDRQYRKVKRWLLLLLDDQGQPLHNNPLQLTGRGAFGASLSQEYNEFQSELGQAYRKAARAQGRSVKGGRFSRSAQAFTIFPVEFGYCIPKDNGRSAYTCVVKRLAPVFEPEKVGVEAKLDRKDRTVTVQGTPYNALMVPRASELGQKIAQLQEEYASFSEPNRGLSADVPSDGSKPWSAQGHIDQSTADYLQDASMTGIFDTGAERIPVHISAESAPFVTDGEMLLEGTIPADGGPVQVHRVEAIADAAPAPAADQASLPVGAKPF